MHDGVEYPLDVLIYATGFQWMATSTFNMITGRDGRTLKRKWEEEGTRTFLGLHSSGFPNLFIVSGPQGGGGSFNFTDAIDTHSDYVVWMLTTMRDRGERIVDVRKEPEAAYAEHCREVRHRLGAAPRLPLLLQRPRRRRAWQPRLLRRRPLAQAPHRSAGDAGAVPVRGRELTRTDARRLAPRRRDRFAVARLGLYVHMQGGEVAFNGSGDAPPADDGRMIGGVNCREVAGSAGLALRRAGRLATQIYDGHLQPAGLTIGQFGVMTQVYGSSLSGPPLTMKELSNAIGMDPTTLNRTLKPLEVQGLVSTAPDHRDRRSRRIQLTASGRERLAQAMPLWRAADDELRRTLGAETTLALNGLLALASEKLRKPQ